MANAVRLDVTGVGQAVRRLARTERAIHEVLRREVRAEAIRVQARAQQLVPVDTGNLQRSIEYDVRDDGLSALVGSDVDYAVFVEFGTRRMAAQPYLLPALEQSRTDFVRAVTVALNLAATRLAAA